MRNCGYEDLDLVPNGQMKLVVVKRNGTTEAAKRRFQRVEAGQISPSALVTSIYESVGIRHKIIPILLLKIRRGKETHPLKFPTATANFSTSFHTATNVAQWHKILSGEWGTL